MLLLISGIVSTAGGCRDAAARSGLTNARSSMEAVVQAALDAVANRDRVALAALLLTPEEHERLLWDELPERNYFPFEYVRRINEINTAKGIRSALAEWGGQRLELVRIEFTKEAEVYSDFTLHRGARVWARRVRDGEEGTLPFFDVIVERNGGFKLMNYKD